MVRGQEETTETVGRQMKTAGAEIPRRRPIQTPASLGPFSGIVDERGDRQSACMKSSHRQLLALLVPRLEDRPHKVLLRVSGCQGGGVRSQARSVTRLRTHHRTISKSHRGCSAPGKSRIQVSYLSPPSGHQAPAHFLLPSKQYRRAFLDPQLLRPPHTLLQKPLAGPVCLLRTRLDGAAGPGEPGELGALGCQGEGADAGGGVLQ